MYVVIGEWVATATVYYYHILTFAMLCYLFSSSHHCRPCTW